MSQWDTVFIFTLEVRAQNQIDALDEANVVGPGLL